MNLALLLYAFLALFFILGLLIGWFVNRSAISIFLGIAGVTFLFFVGRDLVAPMPNVSFLESLGFGALAALVLAIPGTLGAMVAHFVRRRISK